LLGFPLFLCYCYCEPGRSSNKEEEKNCLFFCHGISVSYFENSADFAVEKVENPFLLSLRTRKIGSQRSMKREQSNYLKKAKRWS